MFFIVPNYIRFLWKTIKDFSIYSVMIRCAIICLQKSIADASVFGRNIMMANY